MVTPDVVENMHRAALESMTEEQRLAMAREILATQIRAEAKYAEVKRRAVRGEFKEPMEPEALEHLFQRYAYPRIDSLRAAFQAEADARNMGAEPKVDFFLPLDTELPLQAI